MLGFQICANELGEAGYQGTAHVGYTAQGLAERELNESGRNLVGVDRLDPKAQGNGYHWPFRELLGARHEQVVKLRGAQHRSWQPGVGHDALSGEFGAKVAKWEAVDADNRDEHQMLDPDA